MPYLNYRKFNNGQNPDPLQRTPYIEPEGDDDPALLNPNWNTGCGDMYYRLFDETWADLDYTEPDLFITKLDDSSSATDDSASDIGV